MDLTEKLPYRLTNNYLFLTLMNNDSYSLKLLISSVLGMSMEEIYSVHIRNPIAYGEGVQDKTFILDVAVFLNNHTYLNIELQVVDYDNWPERSLGYLCRTYDNLNQGMDYSEVKPAIHVSILDFTIFPEYPEFFSEYMMLNTKNHHEYTGKFKLYVLDLTQKELATQQDKDRRLDAWADMFKARTWGDLMNVVERNQEFQNTLSSIDRMTADERIRLHCEAVERTEIHNRETRKKLAEQEASLKKQQSALAKQKTALAKQKSILKEQKTALAEKDARIAELERLLAEK
jgi:predicted transposase/invertase (TIGR01784 family)